MATSTLFSMTARRLAAPVAVTSASLLFLGTIKSRSEAEEADPYDNLPEHDERTTCQICLVNRQGPCRDLWRKMEACMKDNLDQKSKGAVGMEHTAQSAVKCDKYLMPWLECAQTYNVVYLLFYNDLYQQEVIEPIEKAIRANEIYEWTESENVVDWSPYLDWFGTQQERTVEQLEHKLRYTAWKKTPRPVFEGDNPVVVELEIPVPLERDGLPLQICYAKDQGGLVLGFDQFLDLKGDGKGDSSESPTTGKLKFMFRPGRTSGVQFFALYKKDTGDDDEARLYCSQVVPLLKVVKESMETS